jgi:hypothetical protein
LTATDQQIAQLWRAQPPGQIEALVNHIDKMLEALERGEPLSEEDEDAGSAGINLAVAWALSLAFRAGFRACEQRRQQ